MEKHQNDKKTNWLELMPSRVPIRIQVMLIATSALVLIGAITVFGSAYTVNSLKNMLVEEARAEATRTADEACDKIRAVVRDSGADSMAEIVNHPAVRAELDMLTREGAIVMATLLDENGRILFQKYCRHTIEGCEKPVVVESVGDGITSREGGPFYLEPKDLPGEIVPISFPITHNQRVVGQVQIALSPDGAMSDISRLSNQITASLLVMVLVVFASLLLTVVLVYYVFRRHLELQQRTRETEHLANIGALASGLAHEIRNPLHAMNLHLEVAREDIEDGQFDPRETTETISCVQRQIDHLNGIVTTFLNAATPLKMEFQEVHLDQLVRELAGFIRPDLESHQVALEVELPDEMIIEGDQRALHQVMLNLILNARNAMNEAGERRIRISAERERRGWRLYVDDSGPGIPEDEEQRIFRCFVSKRSGGTGFGLSIARRIMEAHGGKIGACRSPLGGARFWLEFREILTT